jgi:hypothetical protein
MVGMRFIIATILSIVLCLASTSSVFADEINSPNYKVNEAFFGTGGQLDASSTNYKGKLSAGELVVGNTASGNYQSWVGFNTTNQELLEVAVVGASFDFDGINPGVSTVNFASSTFAVRNYLSSGYVVRIGGAAPKAVGSSEQIDPLTSPTASATGQEQFGINLRANTSPTVGANPTQSPDGTFSFGVAAAGYDQGNLFKYVEDDVIAQSAASSGTTTYTISFILNTSVNTPAGLYGGSYFVNVIPTF